MSGFSPATTANSPYATTTVTLDIRGARTGHANLRYAWSTPVSTIPIPYSGSCGANTRSMSAPTSSVAGAASRSRSATIGPASSATASATGASTVSTHVSNAEVVAPTAARSPRATASASSGTTRLASAPPATISKMMLGTVLALW